MKMGNIFSKEGQLSYILVKNTQASFTDFLRKCGGLVVQVSFMSLVHFTIIRQMAPWVLGRLPSGLSADVENDAIAAI